MTDWQSKACWGPQVAAEGPTEGVSFKGSTTLQATTALG